jgi:hypothetical protein
MQCRKQAMLRVRKNYTQEEREREKEKKLLNQSDGLSNLSKNLLNAMGAGDDGERVNIDWVSFCIFFSQKISL